MDEGNDETCLELGLGIGTRKRDHPSGEENKKRGFFLDFSIANNPLSDDRDSSSSLKNDCREDESNFSCRKKLRLTCDQTTLLEDSFKQHCTLNMAQKHALAEKLNLKPRQVEVWFQNRRARTKLKQTEIDCEYLKKNCERLSQENWRLKKELIELRSTMKMEKTPFLYNSIIAKEAATLRKCPLCVEHDMGSRKNKDLVVMEVVHEPKPNNMHQGRAVLLS